MPGTGNLWFPNASRESLSHALLRIMKLSYELFVL